jgi:fructokinase
VYIAGSVGSDDLGRRAIEILQNHGVNTACVSSVGRPTGQVLVELDEAGSAQFEIATNTAWDNIPWADELQQLAPRADVVCFGTLAQRSDTSRETIQRFLRASRPGCLRILDINLRPPFWDKEIVLQSLELANVLKLNDSELAVLAGVLDMTDGNDKLLSQLMANYALKLVALTRGADGAIIRTAAGEESDLPGQLVGVADTVGAGDAYTAVLAIGLLNDLPLATINAWANRAAAYVCSQPGATPHFPDHLHQP